MKPKPLPVNCEWQAEVMRRYYARATPALLRKLERMTDLAYEEFEKSLYACRERTFPIAQYRAENKKRNAERQARLLAYQMQVANFTTEDGRRVAKYESHLSPFSEHSRRGGQRSKKLKAKG